MSIHPNITNAISTHCLSFLGNRLGGCIRFKPIYDLFWGCVDSVIGKLNAKQTVSNAVGVLSSCTTMGAITCAAYTGADSTSHAIASHTLARGFILGAQGKAIAELVNFTDFNRKFMTLLRVDNPNLTPKQEEKAKQYAKYTFAISGLCYGYVSHPILGAAIPHIVSALTEAIAKGYFLNETKVREHLMQVLNRVLESVPEGWENPDTCIL